jgi:hypothetical protein
MLEEERASDVIADPQPMQQSGTRARKEFFFCSFRHAAFPAFFPSKTPLQSCQSA